MSNIKTIDTLRRVIGLGEAGYYQTDKTCDYDDAIDECIIAIEREVSERYIELPVDADGVPIRVGDLIEFGRKGERLEVTHIGWTKHGDPTIAYRRPNGTLDCSCIGSGCWHVKPRTLEDVLREFGMECADDAYATDWAVAIYAAEIRELMGEGK